MVAADAQLTYRVVGEDAVTALLYRGYTDLTVLDVSAHGLRLARQRLGKSADRVRWEMTDLLQWTPQRRFAVWHDRAVFHFLTDPADRVRYRELAPRPWPRAGI